jgi:putative effector of murein hydrolase
MRRPRDTFPSLVAAALVAVIAGVHFEQYVDFMSGIPTVGVLFLLNAAGGAGLACALLSRQRRLQRLATVGAIGLAAGSLVSIAIALGGSFFGYSEPTLRLPIAIAIVAEAIAIPVLISTLVRERLAAAKLTVTGPR